MRVLVLSWGCPPHVVGRPGKHISDLVHALAGADIDVQRSRMFFLSLARAIMETLRHPDLARARAKDARCEVDRRYRWGIIVQQTIEVYKRVKTVWQQSAWAAVGARQTV